MALTLGSIVDRLGGRLYGDAERVVRAIAPLEQAGDEDISFLAHPKYASLLTRTRAGCVIVGPEQAEAARSRGACIVADRPYVYFARLTQLWKAAHEPPLTPAEAVHPTAVVHPEAKLGEGARIGPLCVVERGACIGPQTVLRAGVTVGERCVVGARCLLHAGVVIGADGFGFALDADGRWIKIEQLGAVRIGDDVEIGANSCIDRGALSDTVIEDGVKIDNLVQIGHNVHVGAHTALAGCAGVAGSARIGAHCTIGGGAVVLGHLALADGVHISAASVVMRSIHKAGHYSGIFPIEENAAWERNAATLKQLHALRERIKALERGLRGG